MYGGGKYQSQNKILPGFYYKFNSAQKDAIAQSARGKAAVALELDWGTDGELIRLTAEQFRRDAEKYFGYNAKSEKLTPIRETFKNATQLICYRLNDGGAKASCKWATAKCSGVRGNDITIVVAKAVDETDKYDVYTFLKDENGNNVRKDKQRVAKSTELKDNDFVTFNQSVKATITFEDWSGAEDSWYVKFKESADLSAEVYASFEEMLHDGESFVDSLSYYCENDAFIKKTFDVSVSDDKIVLTEKEPGIWQGHIEAMGGGMSQPIQTPGSNTPPALVEDAGSALTGGVNGTVTGDAHSAFLAKLERVHYHTLACNSTDETTVALYTEYQKRMSHECGKLGQLVIYGYTSDSKEIRPDSYDVIVLENKVTTPGVPAHYGIFWVLGAEAGCADNKTVQNRIYDGEYALDVDYTQAELAAKMQRGKFMFHETINTADNSEIRVLADINSFETTNEDEGEDYKENQLIRVLYQALTDVGSAFNANWQGIVGNDDNGRLAFKGVVVKYLQEKQRQRAIQNFDSEQVFVEQGESAKSVVIGLPINKVLAMFICYSDVTVN